MGEPIRILELAKTMIRLSGLEPERDIAIEIVGARPGELVFVALVFVALVFFKKIGSFRHGTPAKRGDYGQLWLRQGWNLIEREP